MNFPASTGSIASPLLFRTNVGTIDRRGRERTIHLEVQDLVRFRPGRTLGSQRVVGTTQYQEPLPLFERWTELLGVTPSRTAKCPTRSSSRRGTGPIPRPSNRSGSPEPSSLSRRSRRGSRPMSAPDVTRRTSRRATRSRTSPTTQPDPSSACRAPPSRRQPDPPAEGGPRVTAGQRGLRPDGR